MIQEEDGGFRIQSHYIGFGISIEKLEKQVNDIVEKHPDICERLIEIETKNNELESKKKLLEEEIKEAGVKLTELKKSYSIIEIKEEKIN
jgi:chromosome segregation ATPase